MSICGMRKKVQRELEHASSLPETRLGLCNGAIATLRIRLLEDERRKKSESVTGRANVSRKLVREFNLNATRLNVSHGYDIGMA
ncbi:hypothetical protein HHX47_DHR4000755 [Lentinula edodes]|nr:hypothetical protein HHX47_DHR4000755 [Lentinula edodes]